MAIHRYFVIIAEKNGMPYMGYTGNRWEKFSIDSKNHIDISACKKYLLAEFAGLALDIANPKSECTFLIRCIDEIK